MYVGSSSSGLLLAVTDVSTTCGEIIFRVNVRSVIQFVFIWLAQAVILIVRSSVKVVKVLALILLVCGLVSALSRQGCRVTEKLEETRKWSRLGKSHGVRHWIRDTLNSC